MNNFSFATVHDMNNVHIEQYFKCEEVIAILPASKVDGAMVLCSAIYFKNGSHMMASETPTEVMKCIMDSVGKNNEL